ncbi:hypothetical protein, partial [Mesorhizobium sp. M1A.F.Ca.IN.020.32.1.1]|uniref:hypothetical protein n=1 Tax=Mesorhizobium sp. M1A.F.Ca.IN.020.32.1.1 TaxID=2496763 RepID=UPI0019D49C28
VNTPANGVDVWDRASRKTAKVLSAVFHCLSGFVQDQKCFRAVGGRHARKRTQRFRPIGVSTAPEPYRWTGLRRHPFMTASELLVPTIVIASTSQNKHATVDRREIANADIVAEG